MRVLIVVTHYFRQEKNFKGARLHGSQIEPLARIASLSEVIVGYHRLFGKVLCVRGSGGSRPAKVDGAAADLVDVVVVAMKGSDLIPAIGIDPSYYSVEYVEGDPKRLQFHPQRVLRERLGGYDFYGVVEDDLITRDPSFFAKLAWFQEQFGKERLLAPVRYEMPSTGNLARVIFDPHLPHGKLAKFRRSGQAPQLEAVWAGRRQGFELPSNPHSGCYFLSNEQLRHWVEHSSFLDGDASWIGPLESAMTLSVGKVFDIYKSAEPDPLFLSLEHYGSFYAHRKGGGLRYGDPALPEIARHSFDALKLGWESGTMDEPGRHSPLRYLFDLSRSAHQDAPREVVHEHH